MKTKIHAIAGGIAFLTILCFWTSTLYSELFSSHETVAIIKAWILKGMFLLIPSMMIVGGSGMSLAGKSQDANILKKKKRMPIIAITGLVVLLPAAFYLESKASQRSFDSWFYVVQVIELIAGANNLRLLFTNIRDGLRITGKVDDSNTKGPSSEISLKAQKNGALLLKGNVRLYDSENNTVKTKKITALCRCGVSKNKPFCDGSHNRINFDDCLSEDRTIDKVRVYKGETIEVHYNKLICSHAGVCGKDLKSVFDSSKRPWINPDNGDVDDIKRIVKNCPSGALSWSEPNGNPEHIKSEACCIKIEKKGPYRISKVPLINCDLAKGACPEKYVLCRCGASKNKPYCDGSHADVNWQDS